MRSIILLFALGVMLGCTSVRTLAPVEVLEYKGQRLSSVEDFRENSIKGPQYVNITSYRLEITGKVSKAQSLSYDDILRKHAYSKVITLHCVEGWSATILWKGVLVSELLDDAGIDPSATTLIFHSYDGYTTSLPMSYVRDKQILLAYEMNNVTLPPERGFPFHLVAEDRWGYKWIKWVTTIEASDDTLYRGYWESRGYNQIGDITGPIFE